jgi:hypothetical protein
MANTTFNGPVRSEKGFAQINKATGTGVITTRTLGLKPDFTSLTATVVSTSTSLTYTKNVITINDYAGGAAQTVTLPAATQGDIVVHAQSKDTTSGGTAKLIFDCAGSDVFATGSKVASTATALLIMDTSIASETKLTFTPAAAATNILTIGCYLYFTCITSGTWHFAYDLAAHELATTGTFVWAA